MVKVISFCLWGDNPKYNIGAIKNVDLAKFFYPDFQCWIYIHSPTVPRHTIDELIKRDNVHIFFKTGNLNFCKPMMWRFEPIIDKNVDVMICRDTDTRILLREKLAVDEWLQSDKLLHIMRDHPHHNNLILGGMWGIKKNNLIDFKKTMLFFSPTRYQLKTKRDYDQDYLAKHIYPKFINNSLIHASFHQYESHAINFPIPFCSEKKFVGEYVFEDDSRINDNNLI